MSAPVTPTPANRFSTGAAASGGIPSFQSPYLKSQHQPWSADYIDYGRLLEMIRSHAELLTADTTSKDTRPLLRRAGTQSLSTSLLVSTSSTKSISNLPQHHIVRIFIDELDDEVDRVTLFVMKQQGVIASNFLRILERFDGNTSSDRRERARDILNPTELHDAAQHLLYLLQYLRTNMLAIDKLLAVHDRLIGLQVGTKLEHHYLAGQIGRERVLQRYSESSSAASSSANVAAAFTSIGRGRLDIVYRFKGVSALVGLAEVVHYKWRMYIKSTRQLNRGMSQLQARQYTEDEETGCEHGEADEEEEEHEFKPLSREMSMISMLPVSDHSSYGSLANIQDLLSSAAPGRAEGATSSQPPAVNARMVHDVYRRIDIALNHLSRCSSFVERWALTSGIDGCVVDGEDDDGASVDEALSAGYDTDDASISNRIRQQKRRKRRVAAAKSKAMSSSLNLFNSFLYMVSYYMVAPTSGAYAERLGLSPSMSGAIIGVTAFAALASTFLYSWWTSYSYKDALIFSSVCCLLGNIIYALGLPYDSLRLVLLGRFLNGFGSARAINRRYIADAFSSTERTAASAAFVASSAAGMSFGPALSALMPLIVSKESLWWQEENAPAWIVAVLWALFLLIHVLYFVDPPRAARKGGAKAINGVKKPLAHVSNGNSHNSGSSDPSKAIKAEKPLWKRPACLVTIYLVFLLKAVLELVLSSAAPIAKFYFDWSASATGWYLAIGNALVLPAVYLVTYLSRYFQDRQLILISALGMLLGSLTVIHYVPNGYSYSSGQYIAGTCLLFIAPNVMEAPSMSLLSKNIPESLRTGIFNLGFFTTEAGFSGRVVADSFLTWMGSFGIGGLVNNLYGCLAVVNACTVALVLSNYDVLIEPHYHDD